MVEEIYRRSSCLIVARICINEPSKRGVQTYTRCRKGEELRLLGLSTLTHADLQVSIPEKLKMEVIDDTK